jgi:hypothetical protein
MSILRKVGVLASSVAMLAALAVGVTAGSASASTYGTLCTFINSDESQFVCALQTAIGYPVDMGVMEGSGLYFSSNTGYYEHIAIPNAGNICMQGYEATPYNGGWSVIFEPCDSSKTGQYWKAVLGPIVQGFRMYYWVNEYNPAYCLAWDQDAGTLFANTCRNAWYQQFGINVD